MGYGERRCGFNTKHQSTKGSNVTSSYWRTFRKELFSKIVPFLVVSLVLNIVPFQVVSLVLKMLPFLVVSLVLKIVPSKVVSGIPARHRRGV